jgi:hypothetical protein
MKNPPTLLLFAIFFGIVMCMVGYSYIRPDFLVPSTVSASGEPYSPSNPMPITSRDTGNVLFFAAAAFAVVLIAAATKLTGFSLSHPGKIHNVIIGHNQVTHAYLIQASNIHQITGYSEHVQGNLPGNVFSTGKKGLYILDKYYQYDVRTSKRSIAFGFGGWEEVEPIYMFVPRGEAVHNNFARDVVDGWEHEYIWKIEDWERFEK